MAAPAPFISTDDLSTYLGLNATDDKGTMAVDAACDICRTISEQTFTLSDSTDTITIDGTGTEILLLPEYPVVSVSSVKENGTTLTTFDYAIDRIHGSLLRVANGQSYSLTNLPVWPRGRLNVTVAYKHGWTDEDFPSDLRMVALSIAGRLFRADPDVSSETLGARTVTYKSTGEDLTVNEERILQKYKRR